MIQYEFCWITLDLEMLIEFGPNVIKNYWERNVMASREVLNILMAFFSINVVGVY